MVHVIYWIRFGLNSFSHQRFIPSLTRGYYDFAAVKCDKLSLNRHAFRYSQNVVELGWNWLYSTLNFWHVQFFVSFSETRYLFRRFWAELYVRSMYSVQWRDLCTFPSKSIRILQILLEWLMPCPWKYASNWNWFEQILTIKYTLVYRYKYTTLFQRIMKTSKSTNIVTIQRTRFKFIESVISTDSNHLIHSSFDLLSQHAWQHKHLTNIFYTANFLF